MAKQYTGNRPRWHTSTTAHTDLTNRWRLYFKTKSNSDWWKVKLAAITPQPKKANYWLFWNGCRFAENSDFKALREQQPQLLRTAKKYLIAQGIAV